MSDDTTDRLNEAGLPGGISRLRPGALALTLLLPFLACTNPTTDGPAYKHTLGVYGDWTAYRLEDGRLQVCYVETGLIPVPGAEPDFSGVRLQVSNRAFNPGTNLVRFTLTHLYPHYDDIPDLIRLTLSPEFSIRLAALFDPEGFDMGGPIDDELVDDMTSGDAPAVMLTQIQDLEHEHGVHLGSYSMDGFIGAYEATSQACPLRPERPAGGAVQLVRIDGYKIVEGPPKRYEYSLTGPFFEAGKADTLTIRSIPSSYSECDSLDKEIQAQISPVTCFVYNAERWEFYRNGEYVDSSDTGYMTTITGVCLSHESEQLRLLVSSWDGAATSPEASLSVFYVPGKGIYSDVHYGMDTSGPALVDCLDDEFTDKRDEPFQPCLCVGSAANELYHTTLSQLRGDIEYAASSNEDARPRTVDDDTLNALLSGVSRIQPFVWWDAYSHFGVQRFESSKYAVVSVMFLDRTSAYGSFQQVFVRRLSEDFWTEVIDQNSDRYGFNDATLHGFHGEDTVDLEMCFAGDGLGAAGSDGCWRGAPHYKRQLISVEEWLD